LDAKSIEMYPKCVQVVDSEGNVSYSGTVDGVDHLVVSDIGSEIPLDEVKLESIWILSE
jgi:hypothetical protein